MSSAHDFDFLFGHWRVSHQRLRERLAGSTDWQVFDGSCNAWPLMGGQGNIDDNLLQLPDGAYRAASMRAFDAATNQWAIWWLDGRTPHQLDTPVIGGFEAGEGLFFADDQFKGRAIRVRFRWRETDTAAPRWEQAFSSDGGVSWETNWTMVFERPAPAGKVTR